GSSQRLTQSARWEHIDLESATWTIPGSMMKSRRGAERDFRVPLSTAALRVLAQVKETTDADGLIFPGESKGMTGDRVLDRHLMFVCSPDGKSTIGSCRSRGRRQRFTDSGLPSGTGPQKPPTSRIT